MASPFRIASLMLMVGACTTPGDAVERARVDRTGLVSATIEVPGPG